jgi:hypothetical protein
MFLDNELSSLTEVASNGNTAQQMEGLLPSEIPRDRCTICRAFTLLSVAGGHVYEHHPTLTALETSVHNGCDFCELLWHCVRTANSEEAVATAMKMENQQIIIRANSMNMKIMPTLSNHSAFDELWIDVGEEGASAHATLVRIELFTSRRKILLDLQNLTSGED